MAQTTIKVNCAACESPVRVGSAIVFRPDTRVSIISVPVEHARRFYSMSITHDSTTPNSFTVCGIQVKSGDREEYFFEFPMSCMDQAMLWFQDLHALMQGLP